jgi:Protein of unknown function (DUF1997)
MDIRFNAAQSVEMAVVEQPIPIQHYLRQPQRLVNALAAASQIEQIREDVFRLKMRPLKFMLLSLQPTVDMRVWATSDGVVHIQSVHCEIRGIEYINQRFHFSLVGKLQPCKVEQTTVLTGRADLEVRVELPPPLLFTPRSLLEASGNSLLKSVLVTIKQRLMHHLLSDYRRWAEAQMLDETAQPAVQILPTSNPALF